jgi:PEP-CTERM motif
MKKMRVLAGLMVLSAVGFVATPASAATITLTSDGTAVDADETNSAALATLAITPYPGWAAPLPGSSWVSYTQSGGPANAAGQPPVVVPNNTIVSFFDFFTTTGAMTGSITVLADDSTSVLLDGVLLFPEAPPNTYSQCSDVPIGCVTTTSQVIALNVLSAGVHTLRFDVAQRAEVAFGLNYAGSISDVPEPTSMLLLGTGLLGLTARVRRRFSGRQ